MATPGIWGDLPGVTVSLTKYGVSARWTIFPHYSWDHTGAHESKIRGHGALRSRDSDKGSCTEALQIGKIEQRPEKTPLIGGERPSPSNASGETWSAWQSKSAFLATEPIVRTNVALPKGVRGMLGSGGLLGGTLAMVGLGLLLAASHKPRRGPAHPESSWANL